MLTSVSLAVYMVLEISTMLCVALFQYKLLLWYLPQVGERWLVPTSPVAQEDLRRHEAAIVKIS